MADADGTTVEVVEIEGGPAATVLAGAPAADEVVVDDSSADGKLPAQAELLADGSVRLPLAFPVTLKFRSARTGAVDEQTVAELVMGRLTGADLRAVSAASEASRATVALARSARIPEMRFNAIFDRMDGADAAAAVRVVEHFLSSGRPTGR